MPKRSPLFSFWHHWLNRRRIIRNLEIVQDFIVISLSFFLLIYMVFLMFKIGKAVLDLKTPEFQDFTSDILFLLILVELFRLLIVYLQEHRISVEVAVEVSIVSLLREIIVHGALEIDGGKILAMSAFLLVLGVLLLICNQTPHIEEIKQKITALIRGGLDHR